jgi:cytochrome c2
MAAAMWNHLPKMVVEMAKRRQTPPHLSSFEAADLIGFLFTVNYFNGSGNAVSGQRLFNTKRCVMCHQIGGVGGVMGPSLDSVGRTGSPLAMAAAMWNHGPEMAQAMRERGVKRPNLSATELSDLLAYLKRVSSIGTDSPVAVLPGNAGDGRALFEKKQCIKCHSIQGTGGNVGPDLGRRGLYRSVLEFAAALWNKTPAMTSAMRIRKVSIPTLAPGEMADIVAYLRGFQYFVEPGDPLQGRKLLVERRCTSCHGLGAVGKWAGDLARVEGLGSPAPLIAAMWNHVELMHLSAGPGSDSWLPLTAEEITHLVAYFDRRSRSRR